MLKKYKYEVQITCILQTIYKIYLVDEFNINTCLINTSINFTHLLQMPHEVHELELFINFYKIYFISVLVLCTKGRSYFWIKNHSWFTWTWKEKYKGSIKVHWLQKLFQSTYFTLHYCHNRLHNQMYYIF